MIALVKAHYIYILTVLLVTFEEISLKFEYIFNPREWAYLIPTPFLSPKAPPPPNTSSNIILLQHYKQLSAA